MCTIVYDRHAEHIRNVKTAVSDCKTHHCRFLLCYPPLPIASSSVSATPTKITIKQYQLASQKRTRICRAFVLSARDPTTTNAVPCQNNNQAKTPNQARQKITRKEHSKSILRSICLSQPPRKHNKNRSQQPHQKPFVNVSSRIKKVRI